VIGIFKAKYEPMLVAFGGGLEVSRALKFENKLFEVVRVPNVNTRSQSSTHTQTEIRFCPGLNALTE
jgi:TPP-dependent trihydroxycyclohexane-1,2-dione (THcHDO) dehydratase